MNFDSSSFSSNSLDNMLKLIISECDGEHQMVVDHIANLMLAENYTLDVLMEAQFQVK